MATKTITYVPVGWICRDPIGYGATRLAGTGFYGHFGWASHWFSKQAICPNCQPIFVEGGDGPHGN